MPFTKQGVFTKKPSDFPDVPSPDMTPTEIRNTWQVPLDETRNALNKVVDELNADTAAGNMGAKDSAGATTTVQDLLNSGSSGLKSHKEAVTLDHPDKSVTESKLANSSVSRRTIQSGAVGTNELDPDILAQPTTAIGQQAKFEQIDSQLAQIAYNLQGLPTGETNDASAFIQSIVNLAIANKVKKITLPKNTYRLNSPLYFNGDDLEIDFSGSTIHSYAEAIDNKRGEVGILNVQGSFVEGDAIGYLRSIYQGQMAPPSNAPNLLTFESIKISGDGFEYHGKSRVTTSNNAYFTIGDEVLLVGFTRAEGYPYVADKYEPELRVLAKITDIDGTYIYIDYYSPFRYPSFVNNTAFRSSVIKVKTTKNVLIKNVTIIDKKQIVTQNAPTFEERQKSLAGITSLLVDGLKLENVTVKNHRLNAIYPYGCRNLDFKNIHAEYPQMWGGGEGYTIQFMMSRDIRVENITGIACRHVLDFSTNSNNARVYKVSGINGKSANLIIHGTNEHDIHYYECKGTMGIGSGLAEFPQINSNISMKNCDLSFAAAIDNSKCVDNVLIENSKIRIYSNPSFLNLTIKDSSIEWINGNYQPVVNARGENIKTKFVMDNCELTLSGSDSAKHLFYNLNYDKFVMNRVKVKMDENSPIPLVNFILDGIEDVVLNDVETELLRFRYSNSRNPQARIDLSKMRSTTDTTYYLFIYNLNNCNLTLNFHDSEVEHVGSQVTFYMVDAFNTTRTNSVITGNVHDNFFKGNANAKIHYTYADVDRMFDHDNIIEYKNSGAKFSVNNNVIS